MPHYETNIDLTPIVAKILRVMTEPYNQLLSRLLVEGRVTQQELDTLNAETLKRGEDLADRIAELTDDDD